MAKSLWVTPEEAMRRKKIKKTILYINITLGTVILSAVFTVLMSNI